MKEVLKSKRGITLIALIITIIILLILAMVTINILINQGIIGHAQNAVRGYEVAEEKELIGLGYQNYKMDKLYNSSAQPTVDNATVTGDATNGWTIKFTKTGHSYSLSKDGIIESLTGLTLSTYSLSMELKTGTTVTKTITATKTDITGNVTWSIGDSSIATLSATTGNSVTVTAVKQGSTKITVKCGSYTKECSVKVYNALEIGAYIEYDCYTGAFSDDLYYKSLSATNGYGDQEFQVTESDKTRKWKILGRDDSGNILITTSNPVQTVASKGFWLKNRVGYVNGPSELDAISKIYGHGTHAVEEKTRSMIIEDMNKIKNYTPSISKKYTYTKNTEDGKIYRNDATNSDRSTYYYYENDNLTGEWKTLELGETSPEIAPTYYSYYIETTSDALKMLRYKDDGSTNASYWLSSRCVACNEDYALFSLFRVDSSYMYGEILYGSDRI